jgi:non-ribosomal peptide synthetase component F
MMIGLGELNRNHCARQLRRAGVRRKRAALVFNHGAPMIAALLGALKAGKTYVPLDPAYPAERLSHLLKDSQAEMIITENRSISAAHQLAHGALGTV